MRRKIFSIWSVLLILGLSLAVLVPSCEEIQLGVIEVRATLDGSPWTGAVNYTLTPATGSSFAGTSVNKTFVRDPDDWTCAYISGGPGTFVDITPTETQTLAAGDTITFTLNFVTSAGPIYVDVSVKFKCWTINGTPVDPFFWHPVGPGAIIDAHFTKHVSGGEEGAKVPIKQTDWLDLHNNGFDGQEGPPIKLHAVNGWGAVTTDPPSDKNSQQCTVDGDPVAACYRFQVEFCDHVLLDVETEWEQKICTNYTKNINWIGFPTLQPGGGLILQDPADVVWEIEPPLPFGVSVDLVAWACVEVGEGFEDTNPDNNCIDPQTVPPLIVWYNGPPL
jgi:hypothetical protein